MKIADLSTVPLSERIEYPYSVAYQGEAVRFNNKESADFHASLLGPGVQRFVAVTEPEYLRNPAIRGWRQVSYFL